MSIILSSVIIKSVFNRISNNNKLSKNSLSTGIENLDIIMGGWENEFSLFCSRPGMGKTTFLLNQVYQIMQTIKAKETILYVTTKESPTVIIQRLLAIATQIELSTIQKGELTPSELKALSVHPIMKQLEANNLVLFENNSPTSYQIRSEVFNLVKTGNIPKMIFIDQGRGHKLKELILDLKLLSKEYQIPILFSMPLGRSVEYRESKYPQLNDLESEVVREVDKIIFITRPDYYEIIEHDNIQSGLIHLIVAKNNGPIDIVKLKLNRRTLTITYNTDIKSSVKDK